MVPMKKIIGIGRRYSIQVGLTVTPPEKRKPRVRKSKKSENKKTMDTKIMLQTVHFGGKHRLALGLVLSSFIML